MFLIGNAAACAKRGQRTPDGFYNLERMLKVVTARHGLVGVCGTCMDARGLAGTGLAESCRRSSLEELTDWTLWADRMLVFEETPWASRVDPSAVAGHRPPGHRGRNPRRRAGGPLPLRRGEPQRNLLPERRAEGCPGHPKEMDPVAWAA